MAEEKKPKIDLKKRLGKIQPLANDASASRPVPGLASVPAPPPAVGSSRGSGVPAPSLSTGPGGVSNALGLANPFAKQKEARRAPPQDIKVEVGAEAIEAAKAMKRFIVLAGIGGTVIGIGLGWVFGSGSERSSREHSAIEGAGLLAKDVEAATGKIKDFSEKIGGALTELKGRKFPEAFANELGNMNIPFDGNNLVGKSVGAYDQKTLNLLFQYVADIQALNARKDALRNLFVNQKKKIIEVLEMGEKPQLAFTVLITKSGKGPVASLAPIAESFSLNGDWPKDFQMTNLVSKEKQQVTRYESGDVFTSRDRRVGIPIEPASIAPAFPDDISNRVKSELAKTAQVLNGVDDGPDGDPKPGILKNGTQLAELLRKIAAK